MGRVQPSHALHPIHTDFNGKVPSEFSGDRPSARLWETGWLNLPELLQFSLILYLLAFMIYFGDFFEHI